MAHKRIEEAVMNRLVRQQKSLKERIEQARTVAEGVNSPFWKAYRKMMQDKLDRMEKDLLFNFDGIDNKMTNEQIRCALTTITNFKMFIDGPSDFEKSIEAMEDKLEKVKAEINERKSKL